MISSYLKTALILLVLIFFQVKLSFILEINGTIPDILLLYIIYNSLSKASPIYSMIIGFLAGLLLDLLVGDVIGLSSLVYTLAGFSAAVISREVGKLTKSLIFVIFLGIIFTVEMIYYNILFFGNNFFTTLIYTVIPLVIYNMLIEIFVTYIFPFNFKRK